MRALVGSAMLALIVGGCQVTANDPHPGLGGFNAPGDDPAMVHDTAAFRARLGACAASHPHAIDDNEKIVLRVFFKPNGRLAAPPQLLNSSLTPDAVMLTKITVDALKKCQPFPELPADKYQQWKTLDLAVTPLTL